MHYGSNNQFNLNKDVVVRIPENGMAELSIQNASRKSTQMPVPPASLVQHFGIISKLVMGNLKGSFQAQRIDVINIFWYSRYYN